MAGKRGTPGALATSRQPRASTRESDSAADLQQPLTARAELERRIATERRRMALAGSLMGCLRLALIEAVYRPRTELPDFSDIAGFAAKICSDATNELDSVFVGPLLNRMERSRENLRQARATRPNPKSANCSFRYS